jgi:hypothetical protein
MPEDAPPEASWQVEDPKAGTRVSGASAVAACVAALPCGRPIAWMLRLAPVRALCDRGGRLLARKEATIVRWLRLGGAASVTGEPSPARLWMRRRLGVVRELAVVVLLTACTSQLLVENNAIPKRLKLPQPKWMTQIVWYPRLTQGWQMFSPDAPTGERFLYVDAVTFGGRHVDPLNEVASRVATLPVDRIPEHLQQDEWWHDYVRGIPEAEAYWRALKDWIMSYHLRTGRTEDRIVSFEAKLIETENPPPGERGQRNIRTKVMTSGRE